MISGSKIILRKKRVSDAEFDYQWQTDPELAYFDAAAPLGISYEEYRMTYASELYYSSRNRESFAIDTTDKRHIGNCLYYNIDRAKGEAELGIMIGDRDYWNKGYGTDTVNTLVNHIFCNTRFKRIYLKTLDSNTRAQKCFERCHFTPYGRVNRNGYNFVLMEIYRDNWEELQNESPGNATM